MVGVADIEGVDAESEGMIKRAILGEGFVTYIYEQFRKESRMC